MTPMVGTGSTKNQAPFRRESPKAFGPGGKGIRTPGLLIANETLYQLSYTPVISKRRLAPSTDFSPTEKL